MYTSDHVVKYKSVIMEMDRPPACHFASVQDGKQEIYLEWANDTTTQMLERPLTNAKVKLDHVMVTCLLHNNDE